MNQFESLATLYEHLENSSTEYRNLFKIGNLFQNLRDLKHEENESDEVEKAQWEIDVFNFVIRDNKLGPKFTSTNEKGEIIKYPNLKIFQEKTYEYLETRLKTTHNPILRARYSHVLWLSPRKHTKYAKIALESYLDLINIYEDKDKEKPQQHYGKDVLDSIKNSFYIGCQINYCVEKIKSEMKRILKGFNIESSYSMALRFELIKLILAEKKMFPLKDLDGIDEICWHFALLMQKNGNPHGAINMLELGVIVDQRLKKKTHNWQKQIAILFEGLMIQAENNKNLAALSFCQKSLEYYKNIADKKKIDELEKKYIELIKSMKLTKFENEIDLEKHIKQCKKIAKKFCEDKPGKIIEKLIFEKGLLPQLKDIEKSAEDMKKEHSILNYFGEVFIDHRGHPAQHFIEDTEKKYSDILRIYKIDLQINKIHLIREVFLSLIQNRKLSSEILLKFLMKNSWYGKNIEKELREGEKTTYNWLNILAPSIHLYFNEMNYFLFHQTRYPNLVLSIDSLTLKIEGLLRDICNFSDVTTFFQIKDKKGRNIVREKDLHALLYEKKIEEMFDEDDLIFFKFLLVEQAGFNLRHKIAHSFLKYADYNIELMNLLILAILKIGKYDFVKVEKER